MRPQQAAQLRRLVRLVDLSSYKMYCYDVIPSHYTTVYDQQQFRVCSYSDGRPCIETQYQELDAC